MLGVICKRDILAHPIVTIRSFGWRVFLRALMAHQDETFLSIVAGAQAERYRKVDATRLLSQCIELELRAERVYNSCSQTFSERKDLRTFFETLARQERDHAELLELCRSIARQNGWDASEFAPYADAIARLEHGMDDVEAAINSLGDAREALKMTIAIEASEVNSVFLAAIASVDSEFVRRLAAFQQATAMHITYIRDTILRFDPSLGSECRKLIVPKIDAHQAA